MHAAVRAMSPPRKQPPTPLARSARSRPLTPARALAGALPTAAAVASALALVACGRAHHAPKPNPAVASASATTSASALPSAATYASSLPSATLVATSPPPRASASAEPSTRPAARPRPEALDEPGGLLPWVPLPIGDVVTVQGAVTAVGVRAPSPGAPLASKVTTSAVAPRVIGATGTLAGSRPRLEGCARASNLTTPTTLKVAVEIDAAGQVESANVSGSADSGLTACVGAAFYAMRFSEGDADRPPFTATIDFARE